MEYLICFICYLYTLLTIIDTTNTNTTRVNVISSTCKMHSGDSDCSKYDLQICHIRNICPRRMRINPRGCFDYDLTYTDLKADAGSMEHFQPPSEKIRDMIGFFIVVVNRGSNGQSTGDFVITSCETNRTNTTNGINITTTNVQIGQPVDKTFNFELTIEMDCAISSCYGQECEICGVKTSNILTTQRVKTSNILTTQRVNTGNEASSPLTTSTEHTENSMTTVRRNGNLTVEGSLPVETNINTGQILGIVFGVCGVILVVIVLYILCYHKKTMITAIEDVPEIHIENDGAVGTHEQFERVGEQMNVLSGSLSNINEYPPGTSTAFGPDSQRPIKDDDILNSPIHDSEIQETSTEKCINPEYPQNNCEQDRKGKNKRKKSKRSKQKHGSNRDKNKSTKLIYENEKNVLNYTEPEIDGRSNTVCHENNDEPNTETRSVSQIPDCPSSPGVTQISMTGFPVPSTEPIGGTISNHVDDDTHSPPLKDVKDAKSSQKIEGELNLERLNVEGVVSNIEQENPETEMTNLEQQNPETGVSNLEQQNAKAEVTNLERQNPETIVSNLEQQNSGTERSSLERQNVEVGMSNLEQQNIGAEMWNLELWEDLDSEMLELEQQISLPGVSTLDIRKTSSLYGHYTTEESDYGDSIESKKKKKYTH